MPVFASNVRAIIEPVAGVYPAIVTTAKGVAHPVRVARCVEWTVQHFAFIACAVAVSIVQKPDIRNAETYNAIAVRNESDRNVELIGKHGDEICFAVPVFVFHHANRVARDGTWFCCEWIFQRTADPQTTLGVKRQIHRLGNVGFRRHKLDMKAVRDGKVFLLIFRTDWLRISHSKGERIFSGRLRVGESNRCQEKKNRQDQTQWAEEIHSAGLRNQVG
ncbi:MAG: hypothetical protein O2856_11920 [Planctomycetota bacterium]|nr:hypothetical protein [Planctomycetota bacterium]